MRSPRTTLRGKKIGFVGKGGAGKSTCVSLLARTMRECGYDVCVLDADSTNEGLHLALGMNQPPRPLIDHFGGMVFRGGKVTCPVDDPTLLPDADIDLNQLPPELVTENESGVALLVAGKLADFGVGAGCDGPLVKIARDLIVRRNGEPMTLLVDLKAGIEDTARGVIVGMDTVIVVCDPSMAALGVARSMRQMIEKLRQGQQPATSHLESPELAELALRLFRESHLKRVEVLLNRIPDRETETYMKRVLAESGIDPIASLREMPDIRQSWLQGEPLRANQLNDAMNQIVEGLESAVDMVGEAVR